MTNNKTNFWRGFTWRRFFKFFLYLFLITLTVEILFDYKNWQEYFRAAKLFQRIITSGFVGFFFALWHEPDEKENK